MEILSGIWEVCQNAIRVLAIIGVGTAPYWLTLMVANRVVKEPRLPPKPRNRGGHGSGNLR